MRTDRSTSITLSVRSITRRFPGVTALDDVSIDFRAGEIHSLLGGNGAGKSTLVKIIAGVLQPDRGAMTRGADAYVPRTPAEAWRAGVRTVFQELDLLPNLSVAENLCIGAWPRRWWGIDRRAMHALATRDLERVGAEIDVRASISDLGPAPRSMVAIARAVAAGGQVLILDEPTASLDAREAAAVLRIVRRAASDGLAVILVTHFLEHALDVSDHIIILRSGNVALAKPRHGLSRSDLVHHIAGRDVDARPARKPVAPLTTDRPVLSCRDIGKRGVMEPFSLQAARSEIVGFAGLLGSGRTEAARLIAGCGTTHRTQRGCG